MARSTTSRPKKFDNISLRSTISCAAGRRGKGCFGNHIIEHECEGVRRVRLNFDLGDGAVEVSGALALVLMIKIVIQDRLHPILAGGQFVERLGVTFGRRIDAGDSPGCTSRTSTAKNGSG